MYQGRAEITMHGLRSRLNWGKGNYKDPVSEDMPYLPLCCGEGCRACVGFHSHISILSFLRESKRSNWSETAVIRTTYHKGVDQER
jgi:hypothetical protein